jgi:hypothetical protein
MSDENLVQECLKYNCKSVTAAVVSYGAAQWNLIGKTLGFEEGQMTASTHVHPTPEGKLQALISSKEAELGEDPMKRKLLEICRDQKILALVAKKLHPTASDGSVSIVNNDGMTTVGQTVGETTAIEAPANNIGTTGIGTTTTAGETTAGAFTAVAATNSGLSANTGKELIYPSVAAIYANGNNADIVCM